MTNSLTTLIGMTLLSSTAITTQDFDSSGTIIDYSVAGDGDPVVLIHGFVGSREEWTSPPPFLSPAEQEAFEPVFAGLSENFKVIALDCRGHGRSGKPHGDDDYGTEMVLDVVRLLDHLGLEDAHVVGYSMGAFIAAKLVELQPERVKSLVLGGGGALLEGSEQLDFMVSIGKSLESGRGVEPLILAMTPPGQPAPTAEQIAEGNRMFLANQDEQALAKVALGHQQLTVSKQALRANDVPTLLVVGGNDPLKASSEETKKLMSRSELIVLDGLDHVSTEMSPRFLAAVRDFLEGIH